MALRDRQHAWGMHFWARVDLFIMGTYHAPMVASAARWLRNDLKRSLAKTSDQQIKNNDGQDGSWHTMKSKTGAVPIMLLFFASGFSALVYEIVWMRHLSLVFGNTAYAAATILAGFMGGLALGSWLFGRLADRIPRPLAVYGVLEFLVGVLALLFPSTLKGVATFYLRHAPAEQSYATTSLVQAALIMGILMVPTVLLGGTLPLLARHLHDRFGSLGRKLSLLYGWNTLGAVTGCALSGLYLIGALGVARTTALAVLINFAVGALALVLSRGRESASTNADPPGAPVQSLAPSVSTPDPCSLPPAWFVRLVLLLFGLAGFTSMAYEVLWLRVLIFLNGGTTYWFTVMLTTYLGGLAVGSLLAAPWIDRHPRLPLLFALLQVLLGVVVLATLTSVTAIVEGLNGLLLRDGQLRFGDPATFIILRTLIAMVFVFPSGLIMGMTFPVVGKFVAACRQQVGSGVGASYFVDTVGGVAGSLAAGFLMIPFWGTLRSLIFMAVLNLLIGALIVGCRGWKDGRIRIAPLRMPVLVALTALVGWSALFVIPERTFVTAIFTTPETTLTYLKEDIGGTVTIEQYGAHRTLSINGVNVAGTDRRFQTTQKLQAHLALLLNPDPRRVLQIGFGSGGTAWSVTRHPVSRVDCVEITAAILKAQDQFGEVNQRVLDDPRVHVTVDDARSFLVKSRATYDVILSDSIHPRYAGNGGLYSRDYFRLCRQHLTSNGIFSAWLPMYGLSVEDFRVATRSLKAVFPHVYLFHTPVGRNEWTIILGMQQPLRIVPSTFAQRLQRPEIKADLDMIGLVRPEDLLACFMIGDRALGTFLGDSIILNTDDFPYLDYVAPRSLAFSNRASLLVPLYAALVRNREAITPYLLDATPGEQAQIARVSDSFTHLLEARGIELESHPGSPQAREELAIALSIDPQNQIARDFLEGH